MLISVLISVSVHSWETNVRISGDIQIYRKYKRYCYSNDLSVFWHQPLCSKDFFSCNLYKQSLIVLKNSGKHVSHPLSAVLSSVQILFSISFVSTW